MDSPGRARRVVAAVTIATFTVAALFGVLALVGGAGLGEREGRVLLTTLLVGTASIAVLCYLSAAGTPLWPAGVVGGLLVLVPLLSGLLLIWAGWDLGDGDSLVRVLGVGTVLAATWAQVCLLLVLAADGDRPVRVLLALTLMPVTLVAVVLVLIVLGADPGDAGVRLLGVVAILDVLGTVVTAILARVRDVAPPTVGLRLPPDVLAALDRRAATEARPRDAVAADAVLAYLRGTGPRD